MDTRRLSNEAKVALICAVVVIETLALGAYATLYHLEAYEITRLNQKLDSTKASERTAWGKVYDLQESNDDRCFSQEAQTHLKLFDAEQALAKCQADLKGPKPQK